MQELTVIHKEHLPAEEDDFFAAERKLANYATFMTAQAFERVSGEYISVWFQINMIDKPDETHYQWLMREDFRASEPITSFYRIPMSERPTVTFHRHGNSLYFKYKKRTKEIQHLRAILAYHSGTNHDYSEVLFAFVGDDSSTKKAFEERLKTTILTGFKIDRHGSISPRLEKYHKVLDEVELSEYEYRHRLTVQEILDKAIRVMDVPEFDVRGDINAQLKEIAKHDRIRAIKLCRYHLDLGLKEAKEHIDRLLGDI